METQAQVMDNAAMLERVAEWALALRDRTNRWLWCVGLVMLVIVLAARARLDSYWFVFGVGAALFLLTWLSRKKDQREWQRYEFARQHFRALLECRKTLQSMSKEERAEIRPDVAKWFLDMFMEGGIEHHVLWEYAEEGVMYPATRRMKLESMGLSHDRNFPTYKEVEYAWARYAEIDPEREWIKKLRVRGGYVESAEKLKQALNRHKVP